MSGMDASIAKWDAKKLPLFSDSSWPGAGTIERRLAGDLISTAPCHTETRPLSPMRPSQQRVLCLNGRPGTAAAKPLPARAARMN